MTFSMKLFYDLNKEGVLNNRIQKHLSSLKTDAQRNAYCRDILNKKLHLIRLKNQCAQLNFPFKYDLNHTLQNLDLIQLKSLQKTIEANIQAFRKKLTISKANKPKVSKSKKKKKQGKDFSVQPRISTQSSAKLRDKKSSGSAPKSKPKKKQQTSSKKSKQKRKSPWTKIIYTPMYS